MKRIADEMIRDYKEAEKDGLVILEKDLSFNVDSRGYMILYKDKPIGGAGITETPKGRDAKANTSFFAVQARITIRDILNGTIAPFMLENIKRIERELNDPRR